MKKYIREVRDLIGSELEFHIFGEGHPRVFFTGGIHGGEATGIYVAQKMVRFLEDNSLLKGSVKILPIANPTAFRRLKRTSPYDQQDLNRIFPGDKDSTISKEIASLIWEEAQDACYIVDLHCCGLWGSSYTLALWRNFEFAKNLASMLAIPQVIQSGGTRGQLFTNACDQGIPAVIIELPGGGDHGVIDLDAAEECYQALVGLLVQLGMLAGEVKKPQPNFLGRLQPVQVKEEGVFIPILKPGDAVQKDELLGHLNDQPVHSPVDGVVIMLSPAAFVFKGAYVANIGEKL